MNIQKLYNTITNTVKIENENYLVSRDLSWMKFNKRVLSQTILDTPLMEKLKFVAISASNLDEFTMVRLTSVKQRILTDKNSICGMKPEDEYVTLLNEINGFKKEMNVIYKNITNELSEHGVTICSNNDIVNLSTKEKDSIRKIFDKSIYPVLTPIAYDSTKEFPLIRSKEQCVVAEVLEYGKNMKTVISIIPLPKALHKIYEFKTDDNATKFIKLEDIISMNIDSIFINKFVQNVGTMRILRESYDSVNPNSDLYIKDRVRDKLLFREAAKPIMLEVSKLSQKAIKVLSKKLDVDKENIYQSDIIDYGFINDIPKLSKKLYYDKFNCSDITSLIPYASMFDAIDNDDIILHHPFDSYDPIIQLLNEASIDPNVMTIKQTLYRVSSLDSAIVNGLCNAAKNGKHVSVLLELQARFDEGQNLALIDKLKRFGCNITFGVEKLKTHCKFLSITRRINEGIKIYSHIGTGNYNDKTANIYTDISYFTSSRKIGQSLVAIFNMLSGLSDIGKLPVEGLYYSPNNMRDRLYKLIEKEVKIAKITKEPGAIVIKVNAISDIGMINKLYWASRHNVRIHIICRGACSMKPINENISIKSVVGRFLEHSRIYYFEQGGKSNAFIASADLLTRNLDRRVELLCPIRTHNAKGRLLNILGKYMMNNNGDFIMTRDGNYKYRKNSTLKHIQDQFIEIAEK